MTLEIETRREHQRAGLQPSSTSTPPRRESESASASMEPERDQSQQEIERLEKVWQDHSDCPSRRPCAHSLAKAESRCQRTQPRLPQAARLKAELGWNASDLHPRCSECGSWRSRSSSPAKETVYSVTVPCLLSAIANLPCPVSILLAAGTFWAASARDVLSQNILSFLTLRLPNRLLLSTDTDKVHNQIVHRAWNGCKLFSAVIFRSGEKSGSCNQESTLRLQDLRMNMRSIKRSMNHILTNAK